LELETKLRVRVRAGFRVRFRGSFRCQLIIDSRMPVHDPPGSGSGYRFTIHYLFIFAVI